MKTAVDAGLPVPLNDQNRAGVRAARAPARGEERHDLIDPRPNNVAKASFCSPRTEQPGAILPYMAAVTMCGKTGDDCRSHHQRNRL